MRKLYKKNRVLSTGLWRIGFGFKCLGHGGGSVWLLAAVGGRVWAVRSVARRLNGWWSTSVGAGHVDGLVVTLERVDDGRQSSLTLAVAGAVERCALPVGGVGRGRLIAHHDRLWRQVRLLEGTAARLGLVMLLGAV